MSGLSLESVSVREKAFVQRALLQIESCANDGDSPKRAPVANARIKATRIIASLSAMPAAIREAATPKKAARQIADGPFGKSKTARGAS